MNIEMYRMFFKVQKKHWWFVVKKQIVLDTINRFYQGKQDTKILDIGCGSGLMLNALEEIGETYGMDMSDEAINFSKEIFQGTVKKGFLPDQIPYDDNFFNLVIALDVIEHVEEDALSLEAIRNRLVTGGKVVITVPAFMFMWTKFDDLNEHKRRYTLPDLKKKLLQAGFTIEKITYYNTLLFPLAFLVRMFNKMTGRDGSSDVEQPSEPLNIMLTCIFRLEKYLLRQLNFPFGVSILAVARK